MSFQVNGLLIETDKDGFLKTLEDWTPAVAVHLALHENIELTPEHWAVIHALKDFYRLFEVSPAMRPLVKYIGKTLGAEKGKSIYLMKLFPPSPAKIGSKIAGLPRPDNCI